MILRSTGNSKNVPMIFTRMVLLRPCSMRWDHSCLSQRSCTCRSQIFLRSCKAFRWLLSRLASIFLGERAGSRACRGDRRVWGVSLNVKPCPNHYIYGFAVGAVVVVALRDLVTKRIPARVPLRVIALANAIFVSLSGFGVGLVQGFQGVEAWQRGPAFWRGSACDDAVTLYRGDRASGRLWPLRRSLHRSCICDHCRNRGFQDYPDAVANIGMGLSLQRGFTRLTGKKRRKTVLPRLELMPPAF